MTTTRTSLAPGHDRVAALRGIVERRQSAHVDGVHVDTVTASAIVAVYDALTDENRDKYAALSLVRMSDVAFKLLT